MEETVPEFPSKGGAATNGIAEDKDMTSKDYYFDSYAHFGIHEVCFSGTYGCRLVIHVDPVSRLVVDCFFFRKC